MRSRATFVTSERRDVRSPLASRCDHRCFSGNVGSMRLIHCGRALFSCWGTACDRWDIEFFFFSATGEWKATPRRVLILMTRRRGIRRFSLNCNYKHGRGKSICPCVTPVRQKTHAADAGGVSPQWTGALQIPPTIASSQEFQYSPVPLLPTAFPGRSSLFRAANNDQSSLLSIGDQR